MTQKSEDFKLNEDFKLKRGKTKMPNTDYIAVPNAKACPMCNKVHKFFSIYCFGKSRMFCEVNCHRVNRQKKHHVKCTYDAMLTYRLTQFVYLPYRHVKIEKPEPPSDADVLKKFLKNLEKKS